MVKINSNSGSKGIWSSLESSKPQQKPSELEAEKKINNSINIELQSNFKKPKRFSRINGQDFTINRGVMLTQKTNRMLNIVKALSDNLTFNELIDEAINEYCDKRLNQ